MSTTQPSGRPTSEQRHDELLQHIGGMLLDAAPDGFRRIDLLVRMTVAVQDATLKVYMPDRGTPEVMPPEGLNAAFQELDRRLGPAEVHRRRPGILEGAHHVHDVQRLAVARVADVVDELAADVDDDGSAGGAGRAAAVGPRPGNYHRLTPS